MKKITVYGVPKKPEMKKLTAGKKKFTVQWKKDKKVAEQESQENEISWLFLSKNADQLPGIGYPPVQCVDFFIFLG